MKEIIILGATGSIGDNTLEIIRQHPEKFNVKAIVANSNFKKLASLANEFNVPNICLVDQAYESNLSTLLDSKHKIISGSKEVLSFLSDTTSDVVISGIVGVAGLQYTLAASAGTKILGLANKESIVCGGKIFLDEVERLNVKILPLDSEHNAIYQIFESDKVESISSITLTASGGPFIGYSAEQLKSVSLDQALKHPNWAMGAKNTIDSATLMNKGLEVIEACYLFNLAADKVDVVVHPQSIVHGLVNYCDGSTLAHLSLPSMQVPISYALDYPNRLPIKHARLDLAQVSKLDFQAPDLEAFPMLSYAYESFNSGVAQLINLNMSNEIAVGGLLDGRLKFYQIPQFVSSNLQSIDSQTISSVDDIIAYSDNCKDAAEAALKKFAA